MELFVRGFAVGLGLIVAIGAQNAFVLARAVRGDRVRLVAALCIACDAALITLAVTGAGGALAAHPTVAAAATWGGIGFLVWFGARAARAAWSPGTLVAAEPRRVASVRATVLATLAVTLLNPHTYLDTFVVLAGISAPLAEGQRQVFGAGAVAASVLWFSLLAAAGRALAPLFARPATWRVLDAAVAVTMWVIAGVLLCGQL